MAPTTGFAAFVEGLQKSGGSEKLLSILQQQQAQKQQMAMLNAQDQMGVARKEADTLEANAAKVAAAGNQGLADAMYAKAANLKNLADTALDDPQGFTVRLAGVRSQPLKVAGSPGQALTGDAMVGAVTQAAEAGKPMDVRYGQQQVTVGATPDKEYAPGEVQSEVAKGETAAELAKTRATLNLQREYQGPQVLAQAAISMIPNADAADQGKLVAYAQAILSGGTAAFPIITKPLSPDALAPAVNAAANLAKDYKGAADAIRDSNPDEAAALDVIASGLTGLAGTVATDPRGTQAKYAELTAPEVKVKLPDGREVTVKPGELVSKGGKALETKGAAGQNLTFWKNRAGAVLDNDNATPEMIAAAQKAIKWTDPSQIDDTVTAALTPQAGAKWSDVQDFAARLQSDASQVVKALTSLPGQLSPEQQEALDAAKAIVKGIDDAVELAGKNRQGAADAYFKVKAGVQVGGKTVTLDQVQGVVGKAVNTTNEAAGDLASLKGRAQAVLADKKSTPKQRAAADKAIALKTGDAVDSSLWTEMAPTDTEELDGWKAVARNVLTTKGLSDKQKKAATDILALQPGATVSAALISDLTPEDTTQLDTYKGIAQMVLASASSADPQRKAANTIIGLKPGDKLDPSVITALTTPLDDRELDFYQNVAAAVYANPKSPVEARAAAKRVLALKPGATVTDEDKDALAPKDAPSFAAVGGFATAMYNAADAAATTLGDKKLGNPTPEQQDALAAANQIVAAITKANSLVASGNDAGALEEYRKVMNGVTVNGVTYTVPKINAVALDAGRTVGKVLKGEERGDDLDYQLTVADIGMLTEISRDPGKYGAAAKLAGDLIPKVRGGYKPTPEEWAQLQPLLYTRDNVVQAYDAGNYRTASAALAYLEKNDAAGFAAIPDAVKQGVKAGLEDEEAVKAAEARLRALNLENASFQSETQGLGALNDLVSVRDLGTLSRLKNDPVYRSKWKVSLTQVQEAIGRATRDGKNDVLAKAIQFSAAGVSGLAGLDGLAEEARKYGINLNPYRDIARDESAGAVLQAAAELSDMGSRGLKVLNSATFQARAKRAGVDLTDWVATAQNSANEEARAKNDTEYGKGITFRNNLVEEFVNGRSWESIKSDPNFARVVKTVYGNKAIDFYNYAAGLKKAADAKKALDKQIADLTIKEKVANIANDAARLSLERQRIAQQISEAAQARADRDRQYKLDERRVRLAEKSGDVKEVAAARAAAAKPLLASKTSISTEIRTLRTNVANLFGDRALTDILADDSVKEDVKTLARSYQTRITAAEGELANINLNLDSIYGYPAGTTAGVVAPSTGNAGAGNSGGNTTTTTTTTTPAPNAGANAGISKSGSNWLVAGVTVTPAGATFINQKLSQWSSLTPGERDGMVASVASYLKVNNDTAKRVLNTIAQNGGLE